jgi:hypothetical protein
MWHGKWEIKKPNNPCARYDKTDDTVSVLDAVSGQTRAKVVKTAQAIPRSWFPDRVGMTP